MLLTFSVARNPLFVPELFRSILGFLAEPSLSESSKDRDRIRCGIQIQTPDPDGQRTLAALARTCRTFSEPSLNQLWRRLRSVRPLLRCCFTAHDVDTGFDNLVSHPPSNWTLV